MVPWTLAVPTPPQFDAPGLDLPACYICGGETDFSAILISLLYLHRRQTALVTQNG